MDAAGTAHYVGLKISAAKDLAVSERRNYCVVQSDGVMHTPASRSGALLVLYTDASGQVIRAEHGRMSSYGSEHRGAWWRPS